MAAKFELERGGVRRYLDTVKPEEYRPEIGEVDLSELSLTGLADLYGSDKGSIKHCYTKIYEDLVEDLIYTRNSHALKIAEFGVACGASLWMWSKYLPQASIVGFDIRPECANLCKELDNVGIEIADPAKCSLGTFQYDLIIDDASHIAEEIVATFNNCWSWLAPGGYYVIEDLGCTYNEAYTKQYREHFDPLAKNDRNQIANLVNTLMVSIDQKQTAEHFMYYPQMLVIKKRGK